MYFLIPTPGLPSQVWCTWGGGQSEEERMLSSGLMALLSLGSWAASTCGDPWHHCSPCQAGAPPTLPPGRSSWAPQAQPHSLTLTCLLSRITS